MRLMKYLSRAVGINPNQAGFFIRKGRVSIDGIKVTDPRIEVTDDQDIVFDGNPIVMPEYRYFIMHKPIGYVCKDKDHKDRSVLQLLADNDADHKYYFLDFLAPDSSGLVVFGDDVRWATRTKFKSTNIKQCFKIVLGSDISDRQLDTLRATFQPVDTRSKKLFVNIDRIDHKTLMLTSGGNHMHKFRSELALVDNAVIELCRLRLGRLVLGDMPEGHYTKLIGEEPGI